MNAAHKVSKLKNRLKRLKKQIKDCSIERQGMMSERMRELESELQQSK
jgi:hypothetical protein